jgi:hypothetical protein
MKETRNRKKGSSRLDRFRPSRPIVRAVPRGGFYAPRAPQQPSPARPTPFFLYLFWFLRTYLYSNTYISSYTTRFPDPFVSTRS